MPYLDQISEEIAHFIGAFHLSLEQARLREAHSDFDFHTYKSSLSPLVIDPSVFAAPFELDDYEPALNYRPVPPIFPAAPVINLMHLFPRHAGAVDGGGFDLGVERTHDHLFQHSASGWTTFTITMPSIDPPGSVTTYAYQGIHLSDDDVFSVGGHGLTVPGQPVDFDALLDQADTILSLSPLGDIEAPGSASEMISTIHAVAELLEDAASGDMAPYVVAQGESISGTYVNGSLVEEAPKLEDYHSFDDEEESGTDTSSTGQVSETAFEADVSVTITMGDNTLINNAVLKTIWTGGQVTAVLGDHVEVNAVIQINAIWDEDTIDATLAGWGTGQGHVTNDLFNIASFDRDPSSIHDAHAPTSDLYPAYWTVTQITGDLMIVNWIEQMIAMSDSDMGIVSSSGSYAEIISGDNTGVNHTSIFEIGFGYDLIIIGGSVYDANIIQQINILFDNDSAHAVDGFQTSGSGNLSSSGNLLWNQAAIYTIGAADRFEALPSAYVDAAHSIESGAPHLSTDILHDPAFAGLGALRVLYIEGDLINLQYIKQTSILGDNDQIALAMDALNPDAGASWTVGTGDNALINNAAIYDLDAFGKTYVGGEQYSQETLIQANFISSQPEVQSQDPAMLASEAVLFLDDSMLGQDPDPPEGVYVATDHTASQDDGLQTLLS